MSFDHLRLALCAALLALGPARAADLRIGMSADVTSIDPHFVNITPNNNVAWHIFEALTHVDENARLIPGLAESWRAVDPTTWEFKLRRGVKFHDGTELTAEDVAFSIERPATLTASPGPFTTFTRPIVAREIVDRHTIRLKTALEHYIDFRREVVGIDLSPDEIDQLTPQLDRLLADLAQIPDADLQDIEPPLFFQAGEPEQR